ncbi:MAG: phosphate ABC transporter substrate-binding protein, partial [Eubacteriales bacterium]|nr:phosphate ABC transporter substrate-binding protein [Eubacteriales bacterium]
MKKVTRILVFVIALAALFTGCAIGGNSEVVVVSREDGSGTRGAFIELFGIEEKNAEGKKIDNTTDEAIF